MKDRHGKAFTAFSDVRSYVTEIVQKHISYTVEIRKAKELAGFGV